MFPNPSFQAYAQGQGTTPTGSFVIEQRDPNPNDIYYPIGKFWINQTDVRLWYLNQQSNVITATNPTGALQSTWELISVSSLLVSISDDGNTPVFPSLNSDTPPDNIQLKAGTGISIVGTPASHLITISATGAGAESLQGNDGVTVGPDGSGIIHTIGGTTIYVTGNAGTFTETFDVVTNNHAILVGRGATTAAVPLAVGNTNTVLLGNTGADPSFGQVPNAALVNSSVTLNNGNNITVTGGTPLSLGGVASFDLTGTTNHAIQLGNASGSLTSASPLTNGQLLIGSAGVDPVASTLTAGTGITITNGAGSITIAVDGSTVVEGVTGDDGLNVVPSAGFITLDGVTVVNATNAKPVFFKRNAANTEELDVQLTTTSTSGAKNINKSGLAHFDSASFTVDAATGFVSLSTGADVTGLVMDAGTSPVVPDGSGHITITGAQVATGVVGANVIRSDGTGANTATIQIQRSTVSAVSDSTKNGVSHFDSSKFSVDANGFVTFTGSTSNIPWTDEGGNFNAASNNGYFCTALLTATLPPTPAQGDVIRFVIDTASVVTVTPNTGQRIRIGNQITTAVTGIVSSTKQGDSLDLVYRSSSATWYEVGGVQGSWSVT